MEYCLNKHIKWRVDNEKILICDCKRLIDLKTSLTFKEVIKKVEEGVKKGSLKNKERLLFQDFEKLGFLSKIEVRKINKNEFSKAMDLLDRELGTERVRDRKFLRNKFIKFRKFFIGVFVDNEIVGVICGFPREDYLLISEIAVDSRFEKRGFGKRLLRCFEETARESYKKINVGAKDNAIGFYQSAEYKPFLLVQFRKGEYASEDFSQFNVLRSAQKGKWILLEIKVKKCDLNTLNKLRKKYPKAIFQYIFTKTIKKTH